MSAEADSSKKSSLQRIIDQCRSCGSSSLTDVFSLGSLAVSNFVDRQEADVEFHPLELVLCLPAAGGCGLLQLRHTVSSEAMYRNYWYRSGGNNTMSRHLAGLAHAAESIVLLAPGEIVLDIGANDGTLLRAYRSENILRVGFEPAQNLLPAAEEGTTKIFSDFFAAAPFQKEFGRRQAKIVTAIAMFYDLDDPNAFISDVKNILDPQGIFVIEMHYLPAMLEQNSFDAACHEHLEYYALRPLERLLARHGLEVFDVERNAINGGSFRTYIRHCGAAIGKERPQAAWRVEELRALERDMGLDGLRPYEEFTKRIEKVRDRLSEFVKSEVAGGKKIYVYGASTKGNTILQFCNLDHRLITAAAERNPLKWGKKTVAMAIPIVSEEEARAANPDYFLVLPWHFLPEFLEREQEYLASGGKFLVPLPEPRVVGHGGEVHLA